MWAAKDLTEDGHPGVWWVDLRHEDDETTSWSTVADLSNINAAADARWIAALSPATAPAIEAWLRIASEHWKTAFKAVDERGTVGGSGKVITPDMLVGGADQAALALARSLCPDLIEAQP